MNIYLVAISDREWVLDEAANRYLPDLSLSEKRERIRPCVLESYYYLRGDRGDRYMREFKSRYESFMLDSGTFTFLNSQQDTKIDFDNYLDRYIAFINRHDIDLFFELDIDHIVGIQEVERMRAKLEKETGKKCIPVWHRSRGLDYWKRMISEYKYVAIGGMVNKEIKKKEYDIFIPLLKMAREKGCKVHGLGFTPTKDMNTRYKFDSADSNSWQFGNISGLLYRYADGAITHLKEKGRSLRSREAAAHNFYQWYLYATYAKYYL